MQQVYHSLYARRTSRFQISSYADIWKNVYKGIATHNTEAEVCYLDKTVIINQELFTEGFFLYNFVTRWRWCVANEAHHVQDIICQK